MRPIARLAGSAAILFVVTACGGSTTSDDGATVTPTATASDGDGGVVLEQPAVWPAADVVFDEPIAAAEDFVTTVLRVPATLGEYRAGDGRSGEVEVQFAGDGGTPITRGLLLLRQLGPDSAWFVVAAPNDVVTIATPEQGSRLSAGPVVVNGVARGFEGAVTVTAFLAGDRATVFDQQHTIAGSLADPEPYEVTLDLSAAGDGDVVAILVQGGVGHEADPGDFAAVAVVVGGQGGDGAGLANPASEFCVQQGGTVEIVTAADGSQSGVCHLPDGTSVDEWEYYREHHPDGS